MRYFVIMCDGVIKPANNVTKCESTGRVYFDIDGKLYRYLTLVHNYEGSRPWNRRILIPANCFQQFIHEDWYETRQIEYLLALDEEEDEELNYFQSTDFNAGVIYANLDKVMGSLLTRETTSIEKEIRLPKIQAVLKSCGSIQEKETLDATVNAVLEHFAAVYGERFDIEMRHYNDTYKRQYIVFEAKVKRKEAIKEMTITEIEEALGYKIKVVGEK